MQIKFLWKLTIFLFLCASVWADNSIRMNHIQVIGTHNSYHVRVNDEVFNMLKERRPDVAASLDYDHDPLDQQLDYGVRSFELDVYYQPDGYVAMHIPDIDYESNCDKFTDCLTVMRQWSDNHPNHVPIIVLVQAKDSKVPELPSEVLKVTPEALDQLDQELLSVFSHDQLITPDDVRGDFETLEQAVLENGWPTLNETRGKFLFALHDSTEKMDMYADGRPSLEGRPMFATTSEGRPDAAILVENNPYSENIQKLLDKGYIVRTRADSGVEEARENDLSRFEQALKSGAHIISTDFPVKNPHPDTGYKVVLPNEKPVRCNPVMAPDHCDINEYEIK